MLLTVWTVRQLAGLPSSRGKESRALDEAYYNVMPEIRRAFYVCASSIDPVLTSFAPKMDCPDAMPEAFIYNSTNTTTLDRVVCAGGHSIAVGTRSTLILRYQSTSPQSVTKLCCARAYFTAGAVVSGPGRATVPTVRGKA